MAKTGNALRTTIVGTRGCGKTTFAGLLYEAIVRRSDIPMTFDPLTLSYIRDIIRSLYNEEFPKPTVEGHVGRVSMTLRFRRAFKALGYKELKLDFYDVSGQDVINFIQKIEECTDPQELSRLLDEYSEMSTLLDSDIYIFMLDGAKLLDPIEARMLSMDFSTYLHTLIDYLDDANRKPYGVCMIITKYDLLKYKTGWGEPPLSDDKELQMFFEQKVLDLLPEVHRAISHFRDVLGISTKYLYSYVETKPIKNEDGTEILIPVIDNKTKRLKFSEESILKLLEWFKQISSKV